MKKIGLTLITLGFLAGAYLTVLDDQEVAWGWFLLTAAVGFAGVGLVRIGTRKETQDETRAADNIAIIEQSINNIVEKVALLNAEKESLDTYDVGGLIDERVLDDLNNFVEARETISHVYGIQAYAEVMSHYAGGERYLNRVWSASADGYIDEVHAYLAKALDQFTIAQEKLEALSR